ncbi:uncharacterized protein LOC123271587 [Cotesia glomerata]|uniref:Galectin n=1 Tax=Cotesia glomerata TaxID=32391 RepID=A0AAV7ISJ8_COTGL|nr:uncharacterized protein LOC123271587 [Cotesia glomerata]KAH0557544.1 hypothetical protein KQX54_007851 [Cotesia glomerata]
MNNPPVQALTISFTTNHEIHHWVDRDDSVILKGYVDAITPLIQRGHITFFQIIVNNNDGSRVTVIFCGNYAVNHHALIQLNQIIELSRVQVRKSTFRREHDLLFLAESEINLNHGQFVRANPIIAEVDVSIQLVPQSTGIIFISGWLKLPFVGMDNGRYGSGLIVDGNYKIKVHVNPFVPYQGLIEGVYVCVRGKFCRNQNGIPFVSVNNIQDVSLVPNKSILTTVELSRLGHIIP